MTASIRIGGKRVPCQMCGCHDAKYRFELEGHRTVVCRHCLPWLYAFNIHCRVNTPDKPVQVHIPRGTEWCDYPCKSHGSIPKMFDSCGHRYWYEFGKIKKCDKEMRKSLEFWEEDE